MPNDVTPAPAPAPDAAPAPAVDPAPASVQDGSTPSAAPDAAPEGEPYNPFKFLNQHGSKVADTGDTINQVDPDAPIAEPTPEPEPPATPPAPAAAAEPASPGEDDELLEPAQATAPQGEPNQFRVNLKGAADAEAKRTVLRILREPGVTMDEVIRRAGLARPPGAQPDPAAAPAAEPNPPAAPDPITTLESEISALVEKQRTQRKEFDHDAAFETLDQILAKQQALTKLQLEQAQERTVKKVQEQTQADTAQQRHDTAVTATWQKVAESFPDVGQEGSAPHTAFTEAINAIHNTPTGPDFFKDPAWPAKLMDTLTLTGKVVPKAPAAAAPAPAPPTAKATPPAAAPAVAPRKPSVPVARPAPAPGSTSSADAAPVYDPDRPFDFLRAHGTRVTAAG